MSDLQYTGKSHHLQWTLKQLSKFVFSYIVNNVPDLTNIVTISACLRFQISLY